MGLDLDYIAALQSINKLQDKLCMINHGERQKITDDIILAVDKICKKY